MLRKLLGSLLLGLSLVGLVGCGAAPEEPKTTEEAIIEMQEELPKEMSDYEIESLLGYDKPEVERESEKRINNGEDPEEVLNSIVERLIEENWNMEIEMAQGGQQGVFETDSEKIANNRYERLMYNEDRIKEAMRTKYMEEVGEIVKEDAEYKKECDEEQEMFDRLQKEKEEADKRVDETIKNNHAKESSSSSTKKESQYLVDVITKSEAYTWDLYDIITKGGDLQQVSNICAEMIDLLEGVTMEDCEYEGEFYAVQSLKDSYLNMVTTIGPATMHGIDVSADLPDAYNKINNDTLFLVNELNN